MRGDGQLLDMQLSPLLSADLLGWSLPAWSQHLRFFCISCRCQQCCRSAGADGPGHCRRVQRSSVCWLIAPSQLKLPWGHVWSYRAGSIQSSQGVSCRGFNRGGDEGAPQPPIWTELFHRGVSLWLQRSQPESNPSAPRTAFPAGNPSPCWDSDAARPPATSCKLRWPQGEPQALMGSGHGSTARPSVELAASQQTPAYGGCLTSQHR